MADGVCVEDLFNAKTAAFLRKFAPELSRIGTVTPRDVTFAQINTHLCSLPPGAMAALSSSKVDEKAVRDLVWLMADEPEPIIAVLDDATDERKGEAWEWLQFFLTLLKG